MHGAALFAAMGVMGVLSFLIALFIAAIFLSLAGKLVGIEKASIGRSMIAILGGGILGGIVTLLVALVFAPLAPLLGFLANLWVIKTVFETGWLRAFLAWLLSAVMAAVIMMLLAAFGLFTIGALSAL
ncbi:hypothetical protein A3L08_08945 [Thermococcus pacificus]|uniref:Uncharacterized protein n=2 Tax=Thermococcus pacificus TaxID=71998 RepID=A0A218PA90_9EURY|nr:hypothetical protein A3L08_08945 [Thermococcus pacificus]